MHITKAEFAGKSPKGSERCTTQQGCALPEPNDAEQTKTAIEPISAAYNYKMATLFVERDKHPVDSPERQVAAERILALWITEGE